MNTAKRPVTLQSSGDSLAGALFLPAGTKPAPALVVCHGAAEFKEHYFELCEAVTAQGVACLALDMHGHGGSGGERFHVQIHEWVADVRAGVDYLTQQPEIDPSRIGAFGLSSGGTAILEAALLDERLHALVVVAPTVRPLLPPLVGLLFKSAILAGRLKRYLTGRDLRLSIRWLTRRRRLTVDPEVNEQILADERVQAAVRAFPLPGGAECMLTDTLKRVGGIRVPTLVIWGAEDEVDPPASGRLLYERLTCKRVLEIIVGSGHAAHLDRHRHRVYELTAAWARENLPADATRGPGGVASQTGNTGVRHGITAG